MAGRKSKYTPDVVQEILNAISIGGSDKDAYTAAGISKETFYQWMQKPEFSDQILRARARSKVLRIGRIKKHGENDWRADAWYLERRYPEEYAQSFIIKVTTEQAALLKARGMTASEAWELLMQELDADAKSAR